MTERFLIATDEAGYGPTLGPLVIVATAWKIPEKSDNVSDDIAPFFSKLTTPIVVSDQSFVVGDSKTLFKPGRKDSLQPLRAIAWTALRQCGFTDLNLRHLLQSIAPEDHSEIDRTPWLASFDDRWNAVTDAPFTSAIDQSWRDGAARLVAVRCRLITPSQFNSICGDSTNKSDLLSACTLALARSLKEKLTATAGAKPIEFMVYCDRHGGRRYYGGVLQHTFPNKQMAIHFERKDVSRYQLTGDQCQLQIDFTVGGDSFAPVALSSMIAKYLREVAMNALNEFFFQRVTGKTIKPTAGYPVDAERFIAEVSDILTTEGIHREAFIRSR